MNFNATAIRFRFIFSALVLFNLRTEPRSAKMPSASARRAINPPEEQWPHSNSIQFVAKFA